MKSKRNALESGIEGAIREYGRRRGWMVLKFVCPGQTGVPDRLFIRDGVHVFIEVKKAGEAPTIKQLLKHEEMRAHRAVVHWVDNLEDAKRILK